MALSLRRLDAAEGKNRSRQPRAVRKFDARAVHRTGRRTGGLPLPSIAGVCGGCHGRGSGERVMGATM